jgi:hypothetical protein
MEIGWLRSISCTGHARPQMPAQGFGDGVLRRPTCGLLAPLAHCTTKFCEIMVNSSSIMQKYKALLLYCGSKRRCKTSLDGVIRELGSHSGRYNISTRRDNIAAV